MTVKKILISTRVDCDNPFGETRDAVDQRLVQYVSDLGYSALLVPNCLPDPVRWAQSLSPDGIMLSGGNDIDPATYGQSGGSNQSTNFNRDHTELALIKFAVKVDLPVIGICRGMQIINVAFGGSLLPHFEGNGKNSHIHVGTLHPISINCTIFPKGYRNTCITVNSFHNQGVSVICLANDLQPAAYAEDGIIEAVIHRKYAIGGIQWHPERPGCDQAFDRFFIKYLLETSADDPNKRYSAWKE
jgi:putative glutamine amidotransferase